RRRLLFDGYGRRESLDGVDVGLFHHGQELTRIRRKRFDVAPLPLRVDGVECQRGLARTREAGQHDELIARQVEIDILQIVGPGTPDADILHVTAYYTPGVKGGYTAPAADLEFLDERGVMASSWGRCARVQYVTLILSGESHGARSQ